MKPGVCTRVWIGLIAIMVATVSVAGQCPVSTVTGGLRAPSKIIYSTSGYLLVAEQGFGNNSGRISIVNAETGERRTLLDGLPSGFAPPNNDPSGPSGLAMRGRTLYVANGVGDSVLAGALPNSFVPNPNPTSPIFSSVLAIHFNASVEMKTSGFELGPSDQLSLKNGGQVELSNSGGDKIAVELISDFPDYVPEPRPGLPNGVRQSNPFGLALRADRLYVADASSNDVRVIDLNTGNYHTLTTFGPIQNNRGFGPPVVEAVPDSIHFASDQLLVTLLSGFPFPLGNAEVRAVNPESGENATFIGGLSSAIDVLAQGDGSFLTLEFSADMLAPLPGRLRYFPSPASLPSTVANCLITPTSMVEDSRTRDVYVTEIGTGRVIKVVQ